MDIEAISDYIFMHTKMNVDLSFIERNINKMVLVGDYWILFDPDNIQIVSNVPRDADFFKYFMETDSIDKYNVGKIVWTINHASARHRRALRAYLGQTLNELQRDLLFKDDAWEIYQIVEQIDFVKYAIDKTTAESRGVTAFG